MTQVVIVSGRSGSGKTSALNILEDFGYYAIDNLPLSLLPQAVEKLLQSDICKIALGIDVRTPQADLSKFEQVYQTLIDKFGEKSLKILYVTAQESVLVARFDATRRVHPLMSVAGNLPNAIKREIDLLEPIATRADVKIDTSSLNIHELKERIRDHLGVDNVVTVNILSFGFKYGSPIDADFVFDVRILPNPHWQAELRQHTGLDTVIQTFFAEYSEVDEFVESIDTFFQRWLPEFLHNNRHTVTIAIGCTGGKHRSVYVAENLAKKLADTVPKSLQIRVKHREKSKW
ncbi:MULTISPECIES: RNase adapter RapZ [unclassified Moraxella]|uniref:RNase adapter RapZ n=1 Tax=unclassified Moraxella TaxID=2685852 RepID=UPI003AF98E9E